MRSADMAEAIIVGNGGHLPEAGVEVDTMAGGGLTEEEAMVGVGATTGVEATVAHSVGNIKGDKPLMFNAAH